MADPKFQAGYLYALSRKMFSVAGAPQHIAETIAETLVNANLAGHDSHGVQFVPGYLSSIESGSMDPAAEPSIIKETERTLVLEAGQCSGIYLAKRAMEMATERAKQSETCRVSFVRGHHIGRLGEWAELAARRGCIGIIASGRGGGPDGGDILPYGGKESQLGTNPIAIGVPTGDDAPFVMDYATSVIAGGKVLVARSKGLQLPEGCIVDKDGNPTTDPAAFGGGGSLLAFGKHKGYGLSLVTCLLGGLSGDFNLEDLSMRGVYMQAMDVEAFVPLKDYQRGVRAFLDDIKSTPPTSGFDEVFVPGDFEHNNRTQRLADGIELPEGVWERIETSAEKLGVSTGEDEFDDADLAHYAA